MQMTRVVRCFLLVALIANATAAIGDRPARPRDYATETANGEYVFVMLAPANAGAGEQSELRQRYRASGLYRNDGSSSPNWTVDWYAETIPSSDGIHLIRWGPWAESVDQIAVAFYERGEEINHYHIRELISDESKLERSVSHVRWKSDSKFDDAQGLLEIRTVDGLLHHFSLTDGLLLPTHPTR
jgi:hypothetical protein